MITLCIKKGEPMELKYFSVEWVNEGATSYQNIRREKTIVRRDTKSIEVRTYLTDNKMFTKFEIRVDEGLLNELFSYIEDLYVNDKLTIDYSNMVSDNSSWKAMYVFTTGENLKVVGKGKYPNYVKIIEKYIREMFRLSTESNSQYKTVEGPILFG